MDGRWTRQREWELKPNLRGKKEFTLEYVKTGEVKGKESGSTSPGSRGKEASDTNPTAGGRA